MAPAHRFRRRASALLALAATAALAGCAKEELQQVGDTFGQRVERDNCPAFGVPAYTGDVTLFDPPTSREARAIDVVATITDVRGTCDKASDPANLVASVSFQIQAVRRDAGPARDVTLPWFTTVMRGGTVVVSKQIGQAVVHFDAGQLRAQASYSTGARIARSAAALPEDVVAKVNRKRKATDPDAAVDPMTDPTVKAALSRASFEVLVGFQLTSEQLSYNATR